MKKVLCLFLSVVLFSFSFSFVSCHSASAASPLDMSLDTVLDYAKSIFNSYSTSQCKKISAARSFYFYIILNDGFSSGLSVFDDSGTKFSNDILNFYYEQYNTTKSAGDIYNSNGDIFLQAAGFSSTPWSLRLCSFGVDVESAGVSYPGDWDKPYFKSYYQTLLARYLIAQGETATDPNPGKSGLDIAPGYVSSDEFADSINFDNSQYTPKSNTWLMSYRTDTRYQSLAQPDYASIFNMVLSDDSSGKTSFSELYLLPFFKDKTGKTFYSSKLIHLYLREWSDPNSDLFLGFDVFDFSADFATSVEVIHERHLVDLNSNNLPYAYSISPYPYFSNIGFSVQTFETSAKFSQNIGSTYWGLNSTSYYNDDYFVFFNSSRSENIDIRSFFYNYNDNSKYYYDLYSNVWGSSVDDGISDFGYFASDSMINFTYQNIDTSKIPSGQIVTVSGDTIYNYTITNPDTGDSSKFGDYITNNYTYITNNYGEGGSGSGVGGSVTVDGSIDVGGSVGVDINVSVPDININVNQSGAGGSGSSIANPDDFTSADNVDLNKYYDTAVEQSTGFQKFLKDFFGFLPAELLALILFAVAMAIVCRVFGR